jgi:hypothetical protein
VARVFVFAVPHRYIRIISDATQNVKGFRRQFSKHIKLVLHLSHCSKRVNKGVDFLSGVTYNSRRKEGNMSDKKEEKELKLYTPKEVAAMFGITTASLRSRRARGQIEAVVLNDNNVVYTEEQIRKANLSQRKRGPKPKKEKAEQNEGISNAA